jgi:hypothetical protein
MKESTEDPDLPGDRGAVVRQDLIRLRIHRMKINIRASWIDPTTGSVGKRCHRGQDLVDLNDEAGLLLEDVH